MSGLTTYQHRPMEQSGLMGTGTRTGVITLLSGELVSIIADTRWMMLAIFLCVIADFRFGWGESSKRFKMAKKKGDKIVMAQYKWRTSRALRRSVNKLIDYIMWVSIGVFIGMALLRPIGIDYMMGGVVATSIAVGCEAKSIIGHFFWLHGVRIEEKSIKGFFKAFVIAFAKRKNRDIGEAIEAGFDETDKK